MSVEPTHEPQGQQRALFSGELVQPLKTFTMENIIKITVESTAGAGKSSVAFAIADALRQHGIKCTIGGIEDEAPGAMERTWADRIKAVARAKRTVQITTKQMRRDSIG